MITQTLPLTRLPVCLPFAKRKQPVLEALEHAEYGRLVLVTPEGNTREFTGPSPGPAAHLHLHDWKVLDDLLAHGEMGFAEAYVEGRWSSDKLSDLLTFGLVNSSALEKFFYGRKWFVLLTALRRLCMSNSLWGSRRNIMEHYDLGNDFYKLWLDDGMTYSCALFEGDGNRSLEDAQEAKYRRALRKLHARPADHILEIGCGWGGFAEIAAKEGLRVTALTLSEEQAFYARERLTRAGLNHQTTVMLTDYRKIAGQFDHVVSIGMFEHVGERYWPVYFQTIKNHLKPGGTAMIQSIILDDEAFETLHGHSGFMEQVIFPGGMLPSKRRFLAAAGKAELTCHELFTFGGDYIRTLQHWLDRFLAHTEEVQALGYDEPFLRLWRFYLSSCIAAFASGRTDVMQARLMHSA